MEFVSFEIAKKLKEKGFKEKCIAYYWEKINEHTPSFVIEDNMPEDSLCLLDLLSNHNKAEWSPFIDAPTVSQVLDWLRKEKKIYVTVNVEREDWFEYKIVQLIKNTHYTGTCVYENYDNAMLAGIGYVLDNLI